MNLNDNHINRTGSLAEISPKTKQVFSEWNEDTLDTQSRVFSADYHRHQLDTLISERSETHAIQNLIQIELMLFSKVYREL